MSVLSFLIIKRNVLIFGISFLVSCLHYDSISRVVDSIEVEKKKRADLISNLIKYNVEYNLSIFKEIITAFEKDPTLESKTLLTGRVGKALLQEARNRFILNYHFSKALFLVRKTYYFRIEITDFFCFQGILFTLASPLPHRLVLKSLHS